MGAVRFGVLQQELGGVVECPGGGGAWAGWRCQRTRRCGMSPGASEGDHSVGGPAETFGVGDGDDPVFTVTPLHLCFVFEQGAGVGELSPKRTW